jgi:hypothetical protein
MLDAMNKTELKEYAETLGISVGSRDSVEDVKAKIAEITGETYMPKQAPLKPVTGDGEEEVTVLFHPDGKDNSRVFISHNGVAMSLPRNKEVTIKRKYLRVLEESVQSEFVTERNPVTNKDELVEVKRPTYTYQIVSK